MVKYLSVAALAALTLAVVGCSTTQTAPSVAPTLSSSAGPSGTSVVGTASWYGPGFHGHKTSSGAVYDQEGLTAASVIFPLGTRLRVINLSNNRQVEVTVNDHGPYVKGRGLDLSHRAAQQLGIIGPGTAQVRMDVLQSPEGGPPLGQRYYVRIASYADAGHARSMRQRLASTFPDVQMAEAQVDGVPRYRIQMGAFMDRNQAESRATKLAKLGYSPLVVTE
ncbi:MAG TPA: septal ring lytic transglycosylase RlpA family protein [Candidatus Binataceae bacterium]|nr:septal ring lytic transglycosylase RlpA family protein [Candidatus Binataceae bacterium]